MKKLNVGIYGVAIFMFICLLTNGFDVYAACEYDSATNYAKAYNKLCTVKNLRNDYRANLVDNDDGTYTIEFTSIKDHSKDEFEIAEISKGTEIGGNSIGKSFTVKSGYTLKINPVEDNDLDVVEVKIRLKKSKEYNKCVPTYSCNQQYPSISKEDVYTITLTNTSGDALTNRPGVTDDDLYNYNKQIDAKFNSIASRGSDKIKAEFIDPWHSLASNKGSNTSFQLSCKYNVKNTLNNTQDGTKQQIQDYYDKSGNTQYFYKHEKGEKVNAVLTFDGTSKKSKSIPVCQTECEEAVKVEYGPPVASMAGLCFEYRVKVTSYVNCTANRILDYDFSTDYNYCTPAPVCNQTVDFVRQAGPTEEYESCINKCDGGKYSRNCSDKCYKKVYGTEGISGMSGEFGNSVTVARLANTQSKSKYCTESDGCYYRVGKKIYWVSDTGMAGRWYRDSNYTLRYTANGGETYQVDSRGFYYAIYSSGYPCKDKCSWTGCSKSSYLNKSNAKAAADKAKDAILDAIDSCSAKATCSTEKSEYTITINKDTFTNSTQESNSTTCTNSNKELGSSITHNKNSSTNFNNESNIIIDRDGCYKDGGNSNKHLTEWTIPDSWLDVKNGSVTTDDQSNNNGYVKKDHNYCLPLNIASVNKKWWNAYVNAQSGGSISEGPDKWNITATTKNFGKMLWNFTIKCFYAVNNNSLNTNDNNSSKNECDNNGGGSGNNTNTSTLIDNYSFRVVDKKALFPNRAAGFNWTNDATAGKLGDGYETSPATVIEKIANGKDTNLDYEFNLSKKTLSEIKKYTSNRDIKKNNYTNFKNGSVGTSADNTIKYYTSGLVSQLIQSGNASRANDILGKNNNYK